MTNNLINRLRHVKRWQIWLVGVSLSITMSLSIVSLMGQLLKGTVTLDYIITGAVASLVVATVMIGFVIHFLKAFTEFELIWQQANFDTLTGLPNRMMFLGNLEKSINRSQETAL